MSLGGLCLAETMRKFSMVWPFDLVTWMCAMSVLPSLLCA